jgi:alpha-galactosidase/6-phospho-beta-glucosidase family protein
MGQTQAIGAGLTFEKVWAAIQANSEQMKKTHEETDRRMAETFRQIKESQAETDRQMKETERQMKETARQQKETDRQIKESQAETDRQQKETARQMKETDRQLNKRFGELSNRFGDMVEYMVLPNLITKFEELGFTFTKANRTEIKDREHQLFMEIDALLENGDKVMAVEIKTKPSGDDINDHIERMEKLRVYADLHNDKRIYLGAIAGVVFSGSNKIYALKKGLYVLEPSGETFKITEPKGEYYPHEW